MGYKAWGGTLNA